MAYLVMTAAERMPGSCWGRYRRVAVVEVDDGAPLPKMISERAVGVKRIVGSWRRLNCGKTARCAYRRALAEAAELVQQCLVPNG